MALICSQPVGHTPRFEFIDCGSISINYARSGMATVGFTVCSSDGSLDDEYSDITFGGVRFQGPITSVSIDPIPGTSVYNIRLSLFAFGC